ncbi:MAG: NADH-quinone oxidoreductase subunit NuoF, partial [Promethearchaeota archaeon]
QANAITTANCGIINPEDIEEYIARGGYNSLKKCLDMKPEEVIEEVKKSGLRGRGGAGFPTGLKWTFIAREKNKPKYLVCNGDEGDPGAFMDRTIMESDPHAILEGMLIGAYAIGAEYGFIYTRAEYPLAIKRLRIAIEQAKEKGFIGKNIFGKGLNFDIQIRIGAGAFVCGEETALMASIEGRRGMPRPRPPFPAQSGLWGQPTNINNVKTWATIPKIFAMGAENYAKIGTETSKGTAILCLTGKIANAGLVEIPMGTTIRELVFNIGGGIPNGKKFKAIQIGGPSGGCLPAKYMDTPLDYEHLTKLGAIMGSGGFIVLDEDTCIVELAHYFIHFTQEESCGKCTPCRVGTRRMLEILQKIIDGKGTLEDLEILESTANMVKKSSLCGLGQTAPNPVLTTLKYFKDEYLAHIKGYCPALSCKNLISYKIDVEKCIGCGLCAKNCSVNAITGEKKQPHVINSDICIRCGLCYSSCPQNAIFKTTGGSMDE